VAVDSKADVR
jgi:hypothetical protein